MTIDPRRAQSLFVAALELPDQVARREFLDQQCGDDNALRQRVEALLSAHDTAAGFDVEATGPALSVTRHFPAQVTPGTIIAGRYKLLEAIGEGGMGSVWVAEQKEPVKRKVAIKLIKAGMDSQSVLARFDAERQALAMMDHPNIAKVFDGGVTEQGRPFFVMEYVKGVSLTDYCDQARLSVRERLKLFLPVCQAVQHAHQKGIIHRDLKPSNILVCLYDGQPVPKVIDFGLAKAMHHALTDQSLYTAHGMMLGTPLYMSPEQAELNNLDVDTRADIYSLGVILYELLTGGTPLERQQMKQAAFNEILRLIKEVEPPKPSTRLSGNQNLPSIAAQRGIEPKELQRSLAGDLDWIVMKALDKERRRRYESANGLSRDIERYLSDEAVEACPPSQAYRLKKFIRRNRATVTAASAVAVALVVGIIGFAWQARVASYQRDLANQARESEAQQRQLASEERDRAIQAQRQESAQRQRAEAARLDAEQQKARALEQEAEAKTQAAIAEAVANFQTDMLTAVDPKQLPRDPVTNAPLKDRVTMLQVLEGAVHALDRGSLKDQPLVEARVRSFIGGTLKELARFDAAELNLRKSLELSRAARPAGHPVIALGLRNLAVVLRHQNRLAEAETLFREAVEILRAAGPGRHPQLSSTLNSFGNFLREQDRNAEAESLLREAIEIMRADQPSRGAELSAPLNNLASLLQSENKPAEAERLFRESLEIAREFFPAGHPNVARILDNLAKLLLDQNRLEEAERLQREALQIRRAAYPPGHPEIALGMNNLAGLLQTRNQFAEAEALFRESLKIRRVEMPQEVGMTQTNLARLLQAQKRFAEAEPLFREALELSRKFFPAGHRRITMALDDLAWLEVARERFADAERYFREEVENQRATLPARDGSIARSLNGLSTALFRQRKFDQAIPVLEEAVRTAEAALGRQHVYTLIPLANLGVNYKEVGRLAESIRLLEEACDAAKHTPQLKVFKVQLLDAYAKAADPAQPASAARVTALMRDLLAEARAERPKDSPELAEQLAAVCQKLLGLKPWNDELEPLLREVLAIRTKSVPDDWSTFHALSMLGGVLLVQNKFAEAEPLLLDGFQGMQDRAAAIPLKDKERIPDAATRLVALYTQWHVAEPDKGCDTKAAEWQKKLDEMKSRANAGAPSSTAESKPSE